MWKLLRGSEVAESTESAEHYPNLVLLGRGRATANFQEISIDYHPNKLHLILNCTPSSMLPHGSFCKHGAYRAE